jgi:hypothetical protein
MQQYKRLDGKLAFGVISDWVQGLMVCTCICPCFGVVCKAMILLLIYSHEFVAALH